MDRAALPCVPCPDRRIPPARRIAPALLASALLVVVPGTVRSVPLFGAKTDFPTGSGPVAVQIADLNRDGKLDLVTANHDASNVSVLLGNGDGSFGTKTDFATASGPSGGLALGDLNRDGRPDVVVGVTAGISVLLGNGDGTLGAKTDFPAGITPTSLALADLNRDGKLDVVTTDLGGSANSVAVLLGQGDGTFGDPASFDVGSFPSAVVVADVNQDGRPDLVVGNRFDNTVSVLKGNGDGTFASKQDVPSAGDFVYSVAVADADGDGKLDIAVANFNSFSLRILHGDGSGGFTAAGSAGLPGKPYAVLLTDLDRDGRPDLVGTSNADKVSVALGGDGGVFGPVADFSTGSQPSAFVVGDLNRDGQPDVVSANSGAGTVSVLLNSGIGPATILFGSFTDPVGKYPKSAAVGDFNRDGWMDLGVSGTNDTLSVLAGSGGGLFGSPSAVTVALGCYEVVAADLDRDGRLDLATANAGANTVSILLGRGDGTFGSRSDFGTGIQPSFLVTGDVNRDDIPDLVVANRASQSISVLLGNASGAFGSRSDIALGGVPNQIALADFDRDGDPDLLVAVQSTNALKLFPANGNGGFGAPVSVSTGAHQAYSVAVGDLNRDGRPDIAFTDLNAIYVSVILATGDLTFGAPVDYATGINPAGTYPVAVNIADYNNNGRLDLAVANLAENSVSLLQGNGDGTFQPKSIFPTGNGPLALATADVNRDGRLDLVVSNSLDYTLTVLLNGSGAAAVQPHLPAGAFLLGPAYPSPSSGEVNVPLVLDREGETTLRICDAAGRQICPPLRNHFGSGRHVVRWNGRTAQGTLAPTGVYFCRLEAAGQRATTAVVVLR